jgi:hypothetical protein
MRRVAPALATAFALMQWGCGESFLDLVVPGDAGMDGTDVVLPEDAGADAPVAIPCSDSTDCPSPISQCEPNQHVCVECVSAADCGGNTPHCNPSTHACFSCVVDDDCDKSKNMVCNKAIPRCASKCTNGTECNGLLCDLTYGYCVQCLHDSDCASPQPHCLLPQRYCVP